MRDHFAETSARSGFLPCSARGRREREGLPSSILEVQSASLAEGHDADLPRWVLHVNDKWNSLESQKTKLGSPVASEVGDERP